MAEYYSSNKDGYKTKFKPYKGDMERKISKITGNPESPAQYYKRLAKAADMRLKRLEDLSKDKKYANVKNWAYANAMYDIKHMIGENANRFDVQLPRNKSGAVNEQYYMARLNAVKRFLNAPTSTKSAIDAVFENRASAVNDKFKTDYFNWQNIGKFFNSQTYNTMAKLYGSDTAVTIITKLQKKDVDVKNLVKQIDGRTIRSDAGKKKAIERFEKESGITPEDYFTNSYDDLPLPF